jgi:hypothetical protein
VSRQTLSVPTELIGEKSGFHLSTETTQRDGFGFDGGNKRGLKAHHAMENRIILGFSAPCKPGGSKGVRRKDRNSFLFNGRIFARGWFAE